MTEENKKENIKDGLQQFAAKDSHLLSRLMEYREEADYNLERVKFHD